MTLSFVEKKEKEFNGKKVNLFGEKLRIKSKMIQNLSYHPYTGILQVQFSSGKSYAYFNVPQTVYLKLATSESKGGTFNELVRDQYQYKQIKS